MEHSFCTKKANPVTAPLLTFSLPIVSVWAVITKNKTVKDRASEVAW